MPFGNPVVGREDLIREAIRSPNFVTGETGWRIAQDGSAEFNDVTVRGDLDVSSTDGSYVRAELRAGRAELTMRPYDVGSREWNPARIAAEVVQSPLVYPGLVITSPWESDVLNPPATMLIAGPSSDLDDAAIIIDANTLDAGSTSGLAIVPVAFFGEVVAESASITDDVQIGGNLEAGNIAFGSVVIAAAAGAPTSAAVAFGPLAGTGATVGFAIPNTAAPGIGAGQVYETSVSGVSANGMTVWITRANAVNTTVYWLALRAP